GVAALVMGILALLNTVNMGKQLWRDRRGPAFAEGLTILIGSLVIYAYEIVYGAKLVGNPRDSAAVLGLAYLLLGTYSIGVARTWMLLGGEHQAFLGLLGLVRKQPDATPDAGHGQAGAIPAPIPPGHVPPERG